MCNQRSVPTIKHDFGFQAPAPLLTNTASLTFLALAGIFCLHGDDKEHYRQPFENGFSVNKETAIWNEMLDCFSSSAGVGPQEKRVQMSNGDAIRLPPSRTEPLKEQESSQWINFGGNNAHGASILLPHELQDFNFAAYPQSINIYGTKPDQYTAMFDQGHIGMPLEATSSLTIAQKQKFTIREISPDWGYAREATKAHVRGHQVRKNYKVICWAVGVLEKVVLRWRRRGVGLRGFRHESESINDTEGEDIVKVFRKQKVDVAIDEAVSRVLSMVESPDARQQYHRMLEKYRQAKAELGGSAAATSQGNISNNENDGLYQFDVDEQSNHSNFFIQ